MKPQILFSPAEVATWVFNQVPSSSHFIAELPKGYFCAVGFVRYGKICGGVVWTKLAKNLTDVECTIAGKGAWISTQVGKFINLVPFEVFKVAHVTTRLSDDNEASKRLMLKHGWKAEGLQRRAYDGKKDMLLMGLIKEDAYRAFGIEV